MAAPGGLVVLFAVLVVGDGAPHRGGKVAPSVFFCRRCLQLARRYDHARLEGQRLVGVGHSSDGWCAE